ncbi:hypothetical protein GQ42DRAFT_164393 [Ramicandelaber brevisporus]|nr:hypothetical protein GQ42DRAFT_164393 [Ramicandelaber brevisporus]
MRSSFTPGEMKQIIKAVKPNSKLCGPRELSKQRNIELRDVILSAKSFNDQTIINQVIMYCTAAESDLRKGLPFDLVVKHRVLETLIYPLCFKEVMESNDMRKTICGVLTLIKADDVKEHFRKTTVSPEIKEGLYMLYHYVTGNQWTMNEPIESDATQLFCRAVGKPHLLEHQQLFWLDQ